jgi:CTP synthase (UTP-ammonia lyase)
MPLISRLACSLAGEVRTVRLLPGTTAVRAYGRAEVEEAFRCTFGLNPGYRAAILGGPLRAAGVDDDDAVRVVELAGHPFFVGTLFLPQLASTPLTPHPLIVGYLRAAAAFHDSRHMGAGCGVPGNALEGSCG